MTLSRLEQETIITFNEAESFAEMYTHNGRLKNRLKELAEARTDEVEYRGADHGSVSYRVPKKWIRVQASSQRKALTEEERSAIKERLSKGLKHKQE